jgi:hypothetical protein
MVSGDGEAGKKKDDSSDTGTVWELSNQRMTS